MESKNNYFFDSYAIIETINQSPNYAKLSDFPIITNALCIGEVHNYLLREHGKQTAEFWMRQLKVEILEISKEICIEASALKFKYKKKRFSYPDCIGYITAKNNRIKFLTGDKEFEGMEDVEFVK